MTFRTMCCWHLLREVQVKPQGRASTLSDVQESWAEEETHKEVTTTPVWRKRYTHRRFLGSNAVFLIAMTNEMGSMMTLAAALANNAGLRGATAEYF